MKIQRNLTIAAAIGILCSLAGCTSAPAPRSTPTAAFASEEEAFAAAEDVYRAYNDALNARRQGLRGADPQMYLTGLALEGDIETQNLLASSGLYSTGASRLRSFTGVSADLDRATSELTVTACIDVSAVSLVDGAGVDVTPSNRGDTVAQSVVFIGAPTSLLISRESSEDASTC